MKLIDTCDLIGVRVKVVNASSDMSFPIESPFLLTLPIFISLEDENKLIFTLENRSRHNDIVGGWLGAMVIIAVRFHHPFCV